MKLVRKVILSYVLISALLMSLLSNSIIGQSNYVNASFDEDNDIIIDYQDAGYSEVGDWKESGLTGYNNSKSRYAGASSTNSVSWTMPPFQKSAKYELYFYRIIDKNSDPEAKIEIQLPEQQIVETKINLTEGQSGFVSLGSYNLKSGDFVTIKLTGTNYGKYIRADAVKLTLVKEDHPEVPSPGDTNEFIIGIGNSGYQEQGNQSSWKDSTEKGHKGEKTRYAPADSDAYVTWTWSPNSQDAGKYDILVYRIVSGNADPEAQIDILLNDESQAVSEYVNYTAGKSDWVLLGNFELTADKATTVKLTGTTVGQHIRADAVKFVRNEDGDPGNGGGVEPEPADPDAIILDYRVEDNAIGSYQEYYNKNGKKWDTSKRYQGYNKNESRYALGSTAPSAEWVPNIIEADRYDLYIYKIVSADGNPNAKIKVKYEGGSETTYVNYTEGKSGWVYLGNYPLAEGTDGAVTLYGGLSGQHTRADAIKLKKNTPLVSFEKIEQAIENAEKELQDIEAGVHAGTHAAGADLRLREEIQYAKSFKFKANITEQLIDATIANLSAQIAFAKSAVGAEIVGSIFKLANPNLNLVPLVPVLQRQEDLKYTLSRFMYNAADQVKGMPQGEVVFKTYEHWTDFLFPNQIAGHKQTIVAEEYYEYYPDIPKGMANVSVYRNAGVSVDDQAIATIYHNGKTTTFNLNMNTEKDGWLELGQFYFTGAGDEYVRFTRGSLDESKPTVTLPIQFEVLRERTIRDQSEEEKAAIFKPGYSETGAWKAADSLQDEYFKTRVSSEANASAIYNPAQLEAGDYEVLVHIPERTPNGDNSFQLDLFHNEKVETMVFDQTQLLSGWFRLGEFKFSGVGHEMIKMTKLSDGGELIAASVKFTAHRLNGVVIKNTIVTTDSRGPENASSSLPLTDKVRASAVTPGLSPHDHRYMIDYYKDVPYAKYFVRRAAYKDGFTWNPLLTEAGKYKVTYFFPVNTDPMPPATLTIHHNGQETIVKKESTDFKHGQWNDIGTFEFAGGNTEEYVSFTDLKYFSAFKYEKMSDSRSIIQETIATTAKFFNEQLVDDIEDEKLEQTVNAMLSDQFLDEIVDEYQFKPEQLMTRAEFINTLTNMLESMRNHLKSYDEKNQLILFPYQEIDVSQLLYGIKDQNLEHTVDFHFATSVLSNAIDYTGHYLNVDNFYASNPQKYLKEQGVHYLFPEDSYVLQEAVARLIRLDVINQDGLTDIDKQLTRADAVLMLNEFNGQLLSAGPDLRFDWHMTFYDDFNGENFDWDKWIPDNANRFVGVAGRWAESIEQTDGKLRLRNEVNNRMGASYSSASITSRYSR